MSFVLRSIKKSRWYRDIDLRDEFPWIAEGELPGDPLGDLVPQDCALSIYEVEANETAILRVAAALVCTRQVLDNFDYALVEMATLVDKAKVKLRLTAGETPDNLVNTWHRDIIELSDVKLFHLLRSIWNDVEVKRIPKKKIIEVITSEIDKNLDRTKINSKILESLKL